MSKPPRASLLDAACSSLAYGDHDGIVGEMMIWHVKKRLGPLGVHASWFEHD
ncbi:hypothetical protein NEUTE2DRAFT_161806 [Neurospora tetrasperma FGSC 2509]|nr:hypothetical protein NEUTE2DRAFT_161806 [Neurospora tetrasperma FGSC 2509]